MHFGPCKVKRLLCFRHLAHKKFVSFHLSYLLPFPFLSFPSLQSNRVIAHLLVRATNKRFLSARANFRSVLASESHWLQPMTVPTVCWWPAPVSVCGLLSVTSRKEGWNRAFHHSLKKNYNNNLLACCVTEPVFKVG